MKKQISNSKIQKSVARDDAERLIEKRIRAAQSIAIAVALSRAEQLVAEWPEAWQVVNNLSTAEVMDILDARAAKV